MAEPALSPAAALVRRFDPALFRTALFAPEPARGRLMTLYAFDIELSRALSRASEPMIALMRLQWWRDAVEGIRVGEEPRAHETAKPLHALLTGHPLPAALLDGLIAARECEVEGLADRAAFDTWAEQRFAGLIRLAELCLVDGAGCRGDGSAAPGSPGHPAAGEPARSGGLALACAFALRTALPMAAAGVRPLLPGLDADMLSGFARGENGAAAALVQGMAREGLTALAAARRHRRLLPAVLVPAYLPLGQATPVLRRASRGGQLPDVASHAGSGDGIRLLWRALSGRW